MAAADDEIRHAIGAAQMAASLDGAPLALDRAAKQARLPVPGAAGLARLAVESWLDGCLGEGVATACAQVEAGPESAPAVRRLQAGIARDEARHAALAWDVLEWAIDKGGDGVRHALHAQRDADASGPITEQPDLRRYGLSSYADHARITERVGVAARAELTRRLGS